MRICKRSRHLSALQKLVPDQDPHSSSLFCCKSSHRGEENMVLSTQMHSQKSQLLLSQSYCSVPILQTAPRRKYCSSSTLTGLASQISLQYSRIARSEENFPIRAVLRIDIFAQLSASLKA